MKPKILALAASLFTLFMTPLAWADPCLSGVAYSTYLSSGFSCTIGDKTFSDFAYIPSGTNPVPATSVTVTTITGPDIGLQFNAPWSVTGTQTTDATISFDVAVTSGPALIRDAGLAQLSGVSGAGLATVAELGCAPDGCTPGQWSLFTFDANNNTSTRFADNTIFTPTGSIEVEKDISLSGCAIGAVGCTAIASLSQVQDTFSQTTVPEPASLALFGTALLGFGLIRRRRKV